MLDKFTKHMKRSTVILLTLAILATTGVVAYAISLLFFKGEVQTSEYSKKTYFEFNSSTFFTASGEIGPGESMSINPVITSEATVDMYVFIRVEMPVYNGGGLYELNPDSSWSLVEENEIDGKWVDVYRYDTELRPEDSTALLASSLTMMNITLAEFAEISEIDVSMTGFACRVSDVETIDDAWSYIKSESSM